MLRNNEYGMLHITHVFTNTTTVNRTKGDVLGLRNGDRRPMQVLPSAKPRKRATYELRLTHRHSQQRGPACPDTQLL